MHSTESGGIAHVSSIKLLVGVWIALMVGTWLTVSATYVDLGALNIWIGLAIATAKAYLVAAYYMHLRWDRPFNVLVFVGAFLFLALFIGLAITDSGQYQQFLVPAADAGGGT